MKRSLIRILATHNTVSIRGYFREQFVNFRDIFVDLTISMCHHTIAGPNGLNEQEFISLMQQRLQDGLLVKVMDEDIASAEMVISQLMKVPNLKQALVGHNLIVTKVNMGKILVSN